MANSEKNENTPIQSENQNDQLISSLPLCNDWFYPLRNYNGCWYPQFQIPMVVAFHDQFKPCKSDILIASPPKCGTTWLKALVFSAVNRKIHSPFAQDHPLLHMHPHDCVPIINDVFGHDQCFKFENTASPRLLSLHMSFFNLPESIKLSNCKIVYVCREPKDTLVLTWQFYKDMVFGNKKTISFDEVYELYCNGIFPYGPLWDHYLGYWEESLKSPEKVLFIKYEDMLKDPSKSLKKLAKFMSCPFSEKEEIDGIVDGIVKLCSFEQLKLVDANRKGSLDSNPFVSKKSSLFREARVEDWKNYMSYKMAKKLDETFNAKLCGSGLCFDVHGGEN